PQPDAREPTPHRHRAGPPGQGNIARRASASCGRWPPGPWPALRPPIPSGGRVAACAASGQPRTPGPGPTAPRGRIVEGGRTMFDRAAQVNARFAGGSSRQAEVVDALHELGLGEGQITVIERADTGEWRGAGRGPRWVAPPPWRR